LSTSPASTSTPSALTSGSGLNRAKYSDGDFQPSLPARASTVALKPDNAQWQTPSVSSVTGKKPVAPPKPFLNTNTNTMAARGPPVLPQRSRQMNQGPVDLLDSLNEGGEEEMGGWETLRPSAT
jgi:hypothetical protein